MKEIPIISILMITYNHEAFIAQAIEGILMQKTNYSFKLIITDDCSTDKTTIICKQYAEKYPELIDYELLESNIGAFKNASYCLKKCLNSKAKYIAFCEGDDYWTDPYKLQKQVDFLEANPDFNICFHNVERWKDGQLLLGIKSYPPNRKQNITFIDLLKSDYIETCSGVIRSKKNIFEIPEEILSDTTLYISCLENDKKGHYINEDMAVYRIHEGGVWSLSPKLQKLLAGFHINEYFLHTYTQKEHAAVANHNLKRIAIEISFLSLKDKNFKDFLKWQKKSATFYSAKKIVIYYSMLRKYFLNKNLFKKN